MQNITASETSEPYKYMIGESPEEFKKQLNEWGRRGYKLLVSTKIPLTDNEQSFEQMILAGVLKYDGEEVFKYDLFVAYDPINAETLLNEFAKKDFQFRKSFWFTEGIKNSPNCDGDEISQILCRSKASQGIRTGSVLLMERKREKSLRKRYFVLSGGSKVFVWEKSTLANLKEGFEEKLKESFFVPVGLFYYQLNFRDSVIVEIAEDNEISPELQKRISYKIVRHESGGKFKKEVAILGKKGYRIIAKEKNFAVMARNEEDKTSVSYSIVAAHRKKYLEEISDLAALGARFKLVDYDHHSIDQFEGKLLFEQIATDESRRFEYKAVKLTEKPEYPNKKLKQRIVHPPSESALIEFNEFIKEGFQVRALFYSDGVVVLLEKGVKD